MNKDGERYYLAADVIDNPPAGTTAYEQAGVLAVRLTALARIHYPASPPIELAGSLTDGDGNVTVLSQHCF